MTAPPRAPEPIGPGELLWTDPYIFSARYEKTVAAARAVASVLADTQGHEREGAELQRLQRFVDDHEQAAGPIWTDPYAHFWARVAYELLDAVRQDRPVPRIADGYARELGSQDPSSLLSLHVRQFGRLALGAARIAGVDLVLESPLETTLPTTLPGSGQSLVGSGTIAITGHQGGRITSAKGPVTLVDCPVARYQGCELELQAHGYAAPGIGWAPPAGATDLDYQASCVGLMERALRLVARHQPTSFEQLARCIRWVAFNPVTLNPDETNFVSDSLLLGAFALLGIDNPYIIASASIHELHHNRLFCFEDQGGVLAGDRQGTHDEAHYYSPWRDDLRPLRGVLHGAYVYVPELRFWLACALDPESSGDGPEFARDRVVRIRHQLELGLSQLERYARFTPRGQRLFTQLSRDIRELCAASRRELPGDMPATMLQLDGSIVPRMTEDGTRRMTSREVVYQHWREFDRDRQVDQAVLSELVA